MKNIAVILIISLTISCHSDNSNCESKRNKPFLIKEKVDKLSDGSFYHFIMINGCSKSSRSYMKLFLKEYIDKTNFKPISEIRFLRYRDEGYDYEFKNDVNNVISGNTLFKVYLKREGQNDSIVITDIITYADGQSIFIDGP